MAKNVDNFDVNSISENSSTGYIFEGELHALHNNYPLVSEKLAIPYDILSGPSKKTADEYGIKGGDVKKLIPSLGDKTNYVLHYINLQLHQNLH